MQSDFSRYIRPRPTASTFVQGLVIFRLRAGLLLTGSRSAQPTHSKTLPVKCKSNASQSMVKPPWLGNGVEGEQYPWGLPDPATLPPRIAAWMLCHISCGSWVQVRNRAGSIQAPRPHWGPQGRGGRPCQRRRARVTRCGWGGASRGAPLG